MDWSGIIIAILGGGLVGSVVLGVMNRKHTSADTFQKLSNTVIILRKGLDDEIQARRQDRDSFNHVLDELRNDYEKRIEEIEKHYASKLLGLEMRVGQLEQERDDLLRENWLLRKKTGDKGDDE